MKAEIINVGTEILLGSIDNTNSVYICKKLVEKGIETIFQTAVIDDIELVKLALKNAVERATLVIVTGGLGPTEDDLTKEALAQLFGINLELDENTKQTIENYFSHNNKKMTANNYKQALKLKNSELIPNNNGTAPGLFIELNGNKIFLLPGPPNELIPMFEEHVLPKLKTDIFLATKSINTLEIGESELETILREIELHYPEIEIATYASYGAVEIKIIGKDNNLDDLNSKMSQVISIIDSKIHNHIYGFNYSSLEEMAVDKLKKSGQKISIAESVTGGIITSKITRIPGASEVLERGIVAYTIESKIDELGVSRNTIDSYGVVSEQVAFEMAKGLYEKTKSDYCIATTGFAGPTADKEKKVGENYICIYTKDNHFIFYNQFNGTREAIQHKIASLTLIKLIVQLNNKLTLN
ncbi:competence/damage-inducible protein A [Soehngenia saccharolytica]|nr:competence/damage-inducible protein A [Soehngenia saccharolytica]